MAGGYLPLTVKKLDTPEAINEVNRMFKELFDQVAGDGQTVRDLSGFGTPEGAVSASVGSTFRRQDGASGTTLYKKESGTGATGWVSVDPMTTLGDTDYHNGTNTVRLAGNTTTTRKYLSQVGNGSVSAAPTWEAVTGVSSEKVNYTGTDQTGFSTSFADVTGATITRTIVSTSVFVIAHVNFYQNDGAVEGAFTFNIAGSDVAGTAGIASDSAGTVNTSLCISWLATGLTPGSTTFKLRGKAFTGAGTLRIRVSGGYSVTLTVIEL